MSENPEGVHGDISIPDCLKEILCRHKTDGRLNYSETVLDYHPLTREEVLEIFAFFDRSKDPHKVFPLIVTRFYRAIPNMTCPEPVDPVTIDKRQQLQRLLIDYLMTKNAAVLPAVVKILEIE